MANKIQIRKFLETKKEESLEALRKESAEKQEAATEDFFEAWGERFEQIKGKVVSIGLEYDKLCRTVNKMGSATFPEVYYDPKSVFNKLAGQLSRSSLKEKYIKVTESMKIEESYLNRIEDCRREWNGLIALCGANSAKDGLIILENLDFDISEIEVKAESTALITNIDARKLFIVKEEKA